MTAPKTIVFGSSTDKADPRADIINEFRIKPEELERFDVLVWFYSYEDYSGDSYVLLRDRKTKELFVNESGHCSCYGLEGTFEPTRTLASVEQKRFENAYRLPFVAATDSYRAIDEDTLKGVKAFQTLIARLASKEKV